MPGTRAADNGCYVLLTYSSIGLKTALADVVSLELTAALRAGRGRADCHLQMRKLRESDLAG